MRTGNRGVNEIGEERESIIARRFLLGLPGLVYTNSIRLEILAILRNIRNTMNTYEYKIG